MTEAAAELALIRGPVITMAGGSPIADAVAIRDGRIAAVGTTADVQALVGKRTEVIDLGGRCVMPGLIDCHTHAATDAKDGTSVELRDFYVELDSIPALLLRLCNASATSAAGAWIIGRAGPMQDGRLNEKRLPTRSELDRVMGRHPGFVTFGSHVLIANSEAIRITGINSKTENPRRGLVVKDPATGEPTGEFRDGAGAFFAVGKELPTGGLNALLESELNRCTERGVTCIHDVVAAEDEIKAYQDLRDAGRLPVRVQLLIRVVHSDFPETSLSELGLRQGFGDDRLRIGGVKCSVDGGFTGRTAAFSQPLIGEDHGTVRIPREELDRVIQAHHEAGIRVCVHAIGDKALDMALASFQRSIEARPDPRLRHRIEHMGNWMCSAERLAIARAIGVSAVANPAMLHFLADEIEAALGPVRSSDAFPFRALLDAGVPLGFGSDGPGLWPSDPLRDIAIAVSRTSRSGRIMAPDQAITLYEAMAAQTVTAAWLGYDENRTGSIVPGKLADLVIVREDPRKLGPGDLQRLTIDSTIVAGEIVYRGTA